VAKLGSAMVHALDELSQVRRRRRRLAAVEG